MKILFSPIGMTDPISNFRDGGLLNICRYNDIDKVYLYLSSEVYNFQEKDKRYTYCLDRLSEIKGKKIEYELIERKDLVDVHIFDTFIKEFEPLLDTIHKEYPNDELYVNVSSGTPAMKSALHVLAAIKNYDIIPIQVSTPEKKSNPHVEDKYKYDAEEMWECNEDNSIEESRCRVSDNYNFSTKIRKKMLEELISKYDYSGAVTLVKNMEGAISEKFSELLQGAAYRYGLEYNKARNCFSKYGYKIFDIEQSDKAKIAEYLLFLDIKLRRNELSDLIRGITPILVQLFSGVIKKQLNINIEDYITVDKKYVERWNINKIENSELRECFISKYGELKETFFNSDGLLAIIEGKVQDIKLVNKCSTLRNIEVKIRNSAAHTITAVTDEIIKKKTGHSAKNIIEIMFDVTRGTDLNFPRNFFESYDKMNDILIEALNE